MVDSNMGECIYKNYEKVLYIYFHIKRKLKDSPELRKFKYHGWMHTKNVYDAVCYLTSLENISDIDTILLKTAALYHDTGYIFGIGEGHEHKSAIIARKELPLFGYSQRNIDVVCRVIESSAPDKTLTDILEEIIFDAELEYLGRDYYPFVSELLRMEIGTPVSIWKVEQLSFMKRHKFLTVSAQKLFNRQKEINIRRLQVDIRRLQVDIRRLQVDNI